MKMNLITPDGGFSVAGPDAASLVRLVRAPEWTIEAIAAWQANDGSTEHTIHFAEGCTIIVSPEATPAAPVAQDQSEWDNNRKASAYSDYHKDFYGYRPDCSQMTVDEAAAAFDLVAEAHQKKLNTPQGRAELRANGWVVPPEEAVAEFGTRHLESRLARVREALDQNLYGEATSHLAQLVHFAEELRGAVNKAAFPGMTIAEMWES